MAEQKEVNASQTQTPIMPGLGGGSAPISAVGGMSPAERVAYIQSLQKASPLNKISEGVKKIADSAFGLSQEIFEGATLAVRGIQRKYQAVAKTNKRFGINQHISGLTANVRGQEQLIHEQVQEVNVDLPDGRKLEQKRGLYVDSDWSPKPQGKLE